MCPGLVDTGMFHGVKYSLPFLTPVLEPIQVVNALIKCMNDNRSVNVSLPLAANVAAVIANMFPVEIGDLLKNVCFIKQDIVLTSLDTWGKQCNGPLQVLKEFSTQIIKIWQNYFDYFFFFAYDSSFFFLYSSINCC